MELVPKSQSTDFFQVSFLQKLSDFAVQYGQNCSDLGRWWNIERQNDFFIICNELNHQIFNVAIMNVSSHQQNGSGFSGF